MKKSIFMLMKQESPSTSRPWRICETVVTSDGMRTRLCAGTWETETEARVELDRKERAQ